MECLECGMPIGNDTASRCPKCDAPLRDQFVDALHTIDVAHDGESWDMAQQKIDRGLDHARHLRLKGLKVIHGYGSGRGHTSIIKDRAEHYLRRLAREHGGRLVRDQHSPGAHILYFQAKTR
jgi:hypothetical protein